jgi:GrpB-like predicted nucleotidyltransferase (UPF0157 family)
VNGVTHDGRRYSNAEEDRVELVEYDPRWPAIFEEEAARLHAALAGLDLGGAYRLEHFGSTAIPGIAAKPIIDIVLLSTDPSRWPGLIEPLRRLHYVYWADNPRRDRMFFVKGMPPFGARRTHHVHVRTPEDARPALVFRDYLRDHPGAVARYARLKRELEARHPTDRDAYTAGKDGFVAEIVRTATAGA